MDRFEAGAADLAEMRRQAYATALAFSEENTERALLAFMGDLLG